MQIPLSNVINYMKIKVVVSGFFSNNKNLVTKMLEMNNKIIVLSDYKTFKQFTNHLSILRIGLVLANGMGLLSQLTLPVKLFLGTAFASGNQWQSWIHIEDLSRLFIAAVEEDWEGTFNAVAPHPVSQRTLMKEIG